MEYRLDDNYNAANDDNDDNDDDDYDDNAADDDIDDNDGKFVSKFRFGFALRPVHQRRVP